MVLYLSRPSSPLQYSGSIVIVEISPLTFVTVPMNLTSPFFIVIHLRLRLLGFPPRGYLHLEGLYGD